MIGFLADKRIWRYPWILFLLMLSILIQWSSPGRSAAELLALTFVWFSLYILCSSSWNRMMFFLLYFFIGVAPFLISSTEISSIGWNPQILYWLSEMSPSLLVLDYVGDPWISPMIYEDSPRLYAFQTAASPLRLGLTGMSLFFHGWRWLK